MELFQYKEKFKPKGTRQQRLRTDASIAALNKNNDAVLTHYLHHNFSEELADIRTKVKIKLFRPEEISSFYFNAMYNLNALSSSVLLNNRYQDSINLDLIGQKVLTQVTTLFGMLRFGIYTALDTENGNKNALAEMRYLYQLYVNAEQELATIGSLKANQSYKSLASHPNFSSVNNYLKDVFSTYTLNPTYTANQWWEAATQNINRLNELQNDFRVDIKRQMQLLKEAEEREAKNLVIWLLTTLFVIFIFIFFCVKRINKMLKELQGYSEKLALGVSGFSIRPFPKDAMGALASSISKIDKNYQEVALIAEQIGKGNFNVAMQPRSDADLLCNAILQMKKKLHDFTQKEKQFQLQITKAAIDSQEKERNFIGKELHDNINQLLASVKLYLEYAKNEKESMDKVLSQCLSNLTKAMDEIRKLSHAFVAPDNDVIELKNAVENLIKSIENTTGISFAINFSVADERLLSEQEKLIFYRVIQEQLTNIVKHAKATHVTIELKSNCSIIKLLVSDNGIGFEPTTNKTGIGLKNIYSRVQMLKGQLKITSKPGEGCQLLVLVNTEKISTPLNTVSKSTAA